MTTLPFKGAASAVVTPMKNGEIDFEAFSRIIDIQVNSGVSAVVICGTTGESPTLTEAEKLSLYKAAVDNANGKIKVIAGCGAPSTAFTASLARQAEALGVDAILTVTPYYNKCSAEGLYLHYKTIAESVFLPVIAYNVPSRTGVDIPMETYEKLADIENLAGVKEASGNISKAEKIKSYFGDRFAIYSGNDDLIAPLYAVGGNGVVSVISNIMPKETAELCRLCHEGNMTDAAKLQTYLYPMVQALFSEVNPIPVKTALELMGICSAEMRLPLSPMGDAYKKKLMATMESYGLL
ncbi:MAG: 4-hydroxy-tetrahydrodipicolinate synthase [Clostridia bacterium]|nr:4-hydroxy-tetrahydrodipicolinate synthase [Clostridia bacterium]